MLALNAATYHSWPSTCSLAYFTKGHKGIDLEPDRLTHQLAGYCQPSYKCSINQIEKKIHGCAGYAGNPSPCTHPVTQ